mmetsp:Transcript_26550/g.36565  ORF Transcript_26550/g.36565 Transcript_26550/m.36565 type:complete len:82 (+) Transcript_26550:231-476(+)
MPPSFQPSLHSTYQPSTHPTHQPSATPKEASHNSADNFSVDSVAAADSNAISMRSSSVHRATQPVATSHGSTESVTHKPAT